MGYVYRNGIDGNTPVGVIAPDGCCPPDLCDISISSLQCNAIALLPSGPIWDESKEQGMSVCNDCDECNAPPTGSPEAMCASLVLHARYTASKLFYYIFAALWPSIREANPATAWSTMDEWLDRLGWRDCYNSFCRDPALGDRTPYEINSACSFNEYCPPQFGEDLSRLYKRGVILALWRLRHGIRENLASINFVISSLYSELVIDNSKPGKPCLLLRSTADFANVLQEEPCPVTESTVLKGQKQVKLYLTPGQGLCIGGPYRAYPLMLAAHCIVRSMLPSCCIICIQRKP